MFDFHPQTFHFHSSPSLSRFHLQPTGQTSVYHLGHRPFCRVKLVKFYLSPGFNALTFRQKIDPFTQLSQASMMFDRTTKNRNKRRVFITLHHRDDLSLPHNRRRMGYGAYNWAILITPKVSAGNDCFAYDITNAPEPDALPRFESKPNLDWRYRQKPHVNPNNCSNLVVKIMIGKIPNDITYAHIQSFLESIPIPEIGTHHKQTGVRWIVCAIHKLQHSVLSEQFNIREFMEEAIKLADARLRFGSSVPEITDYTRRPQSTDYSDISPTESFL